MVARSYRTEGEVSFSAGWWRLVATCLVAIALLGACGGGGDAEDTAGDDRSTATVSDEAAGTDATAAPTGSACDTISDAEASSVFGGPVTKEPTAGSSCNITNAGGGFAIIKFESGTLDRAAKTVEETFDTQTTPVSGIGEGGFSFEAKGVSGLMVLQGGRIANVAAGGDLGLDKMKELALAMFND